MYATTKNKDPVKVEVGHSEIWMAIYIVVDSAPYHKIIYLYDVNSSNAVCILPVLSHKPQNGVINTFVHLLHRLLTRHQ